MISPPAYASGATKPRFVEDSLQPIESGGLVSYGYWVTIYPVKLVSLATEYVVVGSSTYEVPSMTIFWTKPCAET
jgi:hypothetical protein